jgi:hypothetical protein
VKSAVSWDNTGHRVVILIDVLGQPFGPIFKLKRENTSDVSQKSIFFGGIYPLYTFLKKHDVLEASSVSVFSKRSTQPGEPLRAILNHCAP